jgi:3-oxoacyl-[acyl-carrier protein] reductase
MDLQLQGKTALVLAASKGLGKACAAALLAEGADIIIGARNATTLEETANELRSMTSKGRVLAVPVDVTDAAQTADIVSAAATTFGKIDILVNNAGGPPFASFETFDDDAWRSAFELSLLSTVRLSRLVLPYMRKTGSGRIINIISLSVKTYVPNSILSTSMRMGVVGMAKMLATELGPDNITVNNRLKSTMGGASSLEEAMAQRTKEIPLGRIGKPEELAALVAFLSSPLAGYITGTTIQVDGGAIKAPY